MNASNVEAKRRVEAALDKIEAAQILLGEACAELSSIIGGIRAWRRCSRAYDEVRNLWRAIAYGIRHSETMRMDSPGPWSPASKFPSSCPYCIARAAFASAPKLVPLPNLSTPPVDNRDSGGSRAEREGERVKCD